MSGRAMVVRPRLGSCRQGGHDGYWHREVVQPDEGLWIHSAPGRRQRRIRAYLRGRARRLDHSQRGSNGRIRSGQQPRQGVGGESQNALTAASTARIATPATRLETFCRYSFATTTSIKLSGSSRKRCNARAFCEMKRRKAYEKPSERKTREKAEAIRRARKAARKLAQREGLIPMPKRREAAPRRAPPPRF